MRTAIRLVIVIVFLAAVFGGIFGWKYVQNQRAAAMQSAPQPPAVVSSAEAQLEEWRPAILAVGSLTAVNGIEVTTEVAGIVRDIRFESGERVEQGEVLVELESSVDQAALEGLIADRELARVEFERASNLLPRRAVSQSQFDEAKARYEGAQARVAEQQARLEKKTIRAPFSGLLGIRQADIGEYLSPGDTVVTLQALDPIYVDYYITARQFSRISPGQKVEVQVDAYPDQIFTGEITAVDSGVDEGTRSVLVRATLDNADRSLRPGMFAEVRTLNPETRTVVTVPRTAISYNTYGDFVFVLNEAEDGRIVAQRQQVETGAVREGTVEVTSGLEAGQQVVRAGLVKLRDGQPVQIDNSVVLDAPGVAAQ
jgi:membrane fusion protein (multidrug efflux system)